METTNSASSVNRCMEQEELTSSFLARRGFHMPCTATVASLPPSLRSGLTTASVASADTTATMDSNASLWTRIYTGTDAILHAEGVQASAARTSSSTQHLSGSTIAIDVAKVAASVAEVGSAPSPIAEHDNVNTLLPSPLACGASHMCCGPPPLQPNEEIARASTAAAFLQNEHSSSDAGPVTDVPRAASPEDAALVRWPGCRIHVPMSIMDPPPSDTTGAETVSSPLGAVTVSPTTCSTTTTNGCSFPRQRSFGAVPPVHTSAEDLQTYRRAGRREAFVSANERRPYAVDSNPHDSESVLPPSSLGAPPLHHHQHSTLPQGLSYADPGGSIVTLSGLTTPVTPCPAAAPSAARAGEEAAALQPHRRRASPRSLSEGGNSVGLLGGALPRVTSLDTVATVSSTRSRPALTPAATGLPGTATSTAGSTAASTTVTSVTYTRKNVCLGALDFYGNPVTSLSTLLAQMSVRSGDRDEFDNLDLRHATQQQHQHQQQNCEKNTLSLQNLKAHTQQVGVMGTEDKIKRLRGKSDTAIPTASVLRRRRASCPIPGLATTGASSSAAAASSHAASKPQVDCLKDVLQECNFLCINDVINAIAETQVHELHEAQQQIDGVCIGAAPKEKAAAAPSDVAAAAADTSVDSSSHASVKPLPPPPRPPPLQTAAGIPFAACTGDRGSPLARVLPACSTSSNFITASAGPGTCVSGEHPSADVIDAQHALSLAAAMTEVSLNLERGSEVSSSASNLALTALSPQRSHFLRAASGRTVTCSLGDGTTQSVTSGSLPNMLSEVPIAISHTSTVATPVLLGRTASCSFRGPYSPVDITPTSANVVSAFPAEPLVRKAPRCTPSGDGVREANPSSVSCQSGGRPATPNCGGAAVPQDCSASTKPSPLRLVHTAGVAVVTSRYVPNWYGLCANEEEQRPADARLREDAACGTSPHAPQVNQDDCDCLAHSIIGELEELRDYAATMASASSPVPTRTSTNATEVRVLLECMMCGSFEDEVTTVRELRKWAKSVAQQEQLQPTTETEVTT